MGRSDRGMWSYHINLTPSSKNSPPADTGWGPKVTYTPVNTEITKDGFAQKKMYGGSTIIKRLYYS